MGTRKYSDEIIEKEDLPSNVQKMGERTLAGLREIARGGEITSPRGVGSFAAFTLPDADTRGRMLKALYGKGLLALPTGRTSIRLRLPFVVGAEEVDAVLERIADCVPSKLVTV